MGKLEKAHLVEAWIKAQLADEGSVEYKASFWAVEKLFSMTHEQPEEAWEIIRRILEQSDHAEVTSSMAAGSLEDLLTEHGPLFIDRIEDKARKEPKFRKVLQGVWLSKSDTPIQDRFYRAANMEVPRHLKE